jgi:hypothetical protein
MHDPVRLPSFCSCHKKETARQRTIIDIYRQYFHHKLPKDKQYWTMCASQVNSQGIFQSGSELGQMLSNKLVTEEQFFGCDINSEVIRLNQIAIPKANWFCHDFLEQMKMHKDFRPAVVDADLLNLKSQASYKISEVLSFLTDCDLKEVLVVCNIMLNNPHNKSSKSIEFLSKEADSFIPLLEANQSFCYAWRSGKWQLHPEMYLYNGSGAKAKTFLASFMFVSK